jgi:hypothetical protein
MLVLICEFSPSTTHSLGHLPVAAISRDGLSKDALCELIEKESTTKWPHGEIKWERRLSIRTMKNILLSTEYELSNSVSLEVSHADMVGGQLVVLIWLRLIGNKAKELIVTTAPSSIEPFFLVSARTSERAINF